MNQETMKFNQIICLDPIGFSEQYCNLLQQYSEHKIKCYDTIPKSNTEIINRIKKADAVLLSWNTRLEKEVILKCHNLKYIGMCCSLIDEASANVDIETAKNQNIAVQGVRDYGDEGVVEYIFSVLIQLVKGLGKQRFYQENTEIGSLTMGIVGMGTLGMMVAKMAINFNMKVLYYSRTRKNEIESPDIQFVPLEKLAELADIVSFHLPRNTIVFQKEHLQSMKTYSIIINTGLSLPFHKSDFENWLQQKHHFAIMDGVGVAGNRDDFSSYENAVLTNQVTGWTVQAKARLAKKALINIAKFLER